VQLHQPDVLQRLTLLDAHLLVVSFATLSRLSTWVPYLRETLIVPTYRQRNLTLSENLFARTHFMVDPTRATYAAYGLGRNSVLRVYGPRILWQYALWYLHGKPIRIRDDTLQRGGDFVVGYDGRLLASHTGRDQSDRPAVGALLDALSNA
jgi:hypothetical protein